jgi:uncharacterized protein (TIGR03435 family)
MKISRQFLIALAWSSTLAHAQSQAEPSFEVASIRPSAPLSPEMTAGIQVDGAQVRCLQLSLRDYIRWAFNVKDYQIAGPDWLAGARFDITAKLFSKATDKQLAEMMEHLLATRFQMKLHRETRELPVYALLIAKGGAKLKASKDASIVVEKDVVQKEEAGKDSVSVVAQGNSGGTTVDLGNGSSFSMGDNKIEAHKIALAPFVETLASFSDRPILDLTGLAGLYDITLEFSPDDFRALLIRGAISRGAVFPPEVLKQLDSASDDSIGAAMERLGLKLESRKAPVEMLVIDRMEKTPSDN